MSTNLELKEQLKKLNELKEKGIITKKLYWQQSQEILDKLLQSKDVAPVNSEFNFLWFGIILIIIIASIALVMLIEKIWG